jgi:hypothetical protein
VKTPNPPVAFKEWAAVCRALAAGVQTVILRKGGIAEAGGTFRPEYDRFWLYPTFFHEPQAGGIRPEFLPLLTAAEAERTPAGTVRLTHVAEVVRVRYVSDLAAALALESLHILSRETVRKRFAYREPGLYVLDVRVTPAGPVELSETPTFLGCKTWVELESAEMTILSLARPSIGG